MAEQSLLLTRRDRDVLKVLHEVRRGHITQREGAVQLNERCARVASWYGGLRLTETVLSSTGRAAGPRRTGIAEKIEKRAVTIIQRECAFGPTLASEYLVRDHQITVSRETVRKWMLQTGLWKRRKQRIEQVHVWRPRRSR